MPGLAEDATIPLRVVDPGGDGPHPAVVYYPGPTWVTADPRRDEATMRALAATLDAVVVGVGHRQRPGASVPRPRWRTPTRPCSTSRATPPTSTPTRTG